MCCAESPAAPLSRSALRESRSYRPYPITPPYPRHDAAPALLRARPLALRDGLPVPRREARGSPAPTPALAWVASQRSPGLLVWRPGLPGTGFCVACSFLPPSLPDHPRCDHASIRLAEHSLRPHVAAVVGSHTPARCRPAQVAVAQAPYLVHPKL